MNSKLLTCLITTFSCSLSLFAQTPQSYWQQYSADPNNTVYNLYYNTSTTAKVVVKSPSSDCGQMQILNPTGSEASFCFAGYASGMGASTLSSSSSNNIWGVGCGVWGIGSDVFGIGNRGFGGPIFNVKSNGCVGIGTSSPGNKLSVVGGFGGGNLVKLANTTSGGESSIIYSSNGQSDWVAGSGAWGNAGKYIIGSGGALVAVQTNGNVGIGTTNPGSYKLAVEGKLGAREIVVTTASWADHVFQDNYDLKPISHVESFIKKEKHLEGIPTAEDVRKNGVNVGEVQAKLLEKIEELTLYMIEMKKENTMLKERIVAIESKGN